MSVDPIAEKYAYVTTFNYAENEPVANIDLWGLQKFNMTWNDNNLKNATKEEISKFRYESTKDAVAVVESVALDIIGAVAFDVFASTMIGGKILREISEVGENIGKRVKNVIGKGEEGVEVVIRKTKSEGKGIRITDKKGNIKDITSKRVKEYEPQPRNPTGKPNRINYKKNPDRLPKKSKILDGSKGKKRTPTKKELKILDKY